MMLGPEGLGGSEPRSPPRPFLQKTRDAHTLLLPAEQCWALGGADFYSLNMGTNKLLSILWFPFLKLITPVRGAIPTGTDNLIPRRVRGSGSRASPPASHLPPPTSHIPSPSSLPLMTCHPAQKAYCRAQMEGPPVRLFPVLPQE